MLLDQEIFASSTPINRLPIGLFLSAAACENLPQTKSGLFNKIVGQACKSDSREQLVGRLPSLGVKKWLLPKIEAVT